MDIQVNDVSKIYGTGENKVVALCHANMTIHSGDFISIMGPSGSGKSTLLHIISGLDTPTSGKVLYGDMEDYLQMVRRYTHVTKITQRMVSELIDHIDVYHAEKRDGVTNQRIVIHYNCIGAFEVPDRKKIPEADIIMETRKGVAVSYAPAEVAV